jgi:mannan endo-1,4-beta-mannosidase
MARDNWENVDREYPYLSSASTSHKDAYFQTIIGTVMDEFRNGGAYVGTSPWAYGGIYRPETQVANEFGKRVPMINFTLDTSLTIFANLGMVWAGDPPHESPGWYDLYNTDKAMDIVHAQQRTIAKWIQKHGRNAMDS